MKYLAPVPKQYVDESGIPYSGGTVSVYLHGTTELAEIYSDATGEALMENPCTLDSNGSWQCFVPSEVPLNYIVTDADGNVVSSFINVVIPEGGGGSSSDMEVVGTPNEILVDRRRQKFVVALSSTIKNSISALADSVVSLLYGLASKADKVSGATNGHLAGLDSSGNLIDSGKKAADFATDAHLAAETARAQAAEAAAKTEVVQGENCTIEKTTAADGHDVYTVNADGKPQVPSDWNQSDNTKVDYIKNKPNLGLKADKVQGAPVGNLAALDATGNLIDSGKKAADFATDAQGAKADSAIQGVKVNGTALSKDGNNVVDVPVPTASAATPLKDGTASVGSSTQWARGDHRHPTDDSREAVSNKKQVVNDSSTTEYPSSKAVADFVNSSVATNTANFLGSFTLTDLSLTYPATDVQIAAALNSHTWPTGVTPTNNDYVYVEIQDPQTTGIDDKVERFKFSDILESWGYEYTLNNSSFTAAEMATLESGITASDKTTWNNHVGNTSNPHNVTAAQVGAEPAFSVLPIAKGGTGKTTAEGAANYLLTALPNWNADPTDSVKLIRRDVSGAATFGQVTFLTVWNYINKKISYVLGLSENGYTGNAATASAAQSGSALETAINAKVDSNKSVAIGDVRVSRTGQTGSGWYKVAETSFNYSNGNVNAIFDVYASLANGKYVGNLSFCVRSSANDVTVNYNKLFTDSWSTIYNFKIVVKGIINAATIELWASCTFLYGGVTLVERNTSDYTSGGVKNKWSYIPHINDGGTDAPVSDSANNVYVYDTEIVSKYTKPSTGIPSTDLASAVQTSLGKADTALQSHQAVSDNNPTLAWGSTSTVGTVGSTNLQVTMPSNPASGKADNTPTFTEASTRANLIGSNENMPTILGKVKKWFTDLKALAFKDKVSDSDISGTISDSHIASASTWTGKQNALPTTGTASTTYAINVSGKAATAVNNEDSVQLIKGMYAMESNSHNIPDLIDEIRVLHGARCGSVQIYSKYTKDNVTIGTGWYNFEYLPHRGNATGDSATYGTLLLSGMAVTTTFYVLCYCRGKVDHLWQLTNTEGSYPNMSVGNASTASAAASGSALETAINSKLDNTGDASNTTSTFTKASDDTSTMASGVKLSAIFTAISSFFASLKALAFKATVGTGDIDNDAITAAKVKDNETLPVNVSGNAASATNLAPGGTSGQYLKSNGDGNAPSWDDTSNLVSGETRKLFGVKRALVNGTYTALLKVNVLDATNYAYSGAIFSFTARTANKQNVKGIITVSAFEYNEPSTIVSRTLLIDSKFVNDGSSIPKFYVRQTTANNKWAYELWVRVTTNDCVISVNVVNDSRNFLETMSDTSTTAPERLTESDLYSNVRAKCTSNTVNISKVGTSTNPVYVDTDGSVKACGFQVNFGTPIAGANVLNIITA